MSNITLGRGGFKRDRRQSREINEEKYSIAWHPCFRKLEEKTGEKEYNTEVNQKTRDSVDLLEKKKSRWKVERKESRGEQNKQ